MAATAVAGYVQGFKGDYLSRAACPCELASVVIIRDLLLPLLCWVTGYRGGRRGGPEVFGGFGDPCYPRHYWPAAWKGEQTGTSQFSIAVYRKDRLKEFDPQLWDFIE
jgi:hypothetical protein